MDIRSYIKQNFKNNKIEEISDAINSSISEHDEITLPGLGVFFELLWENSNESDKSNILNTLKKALNWFFYKK
mgnify:FL=1